MSAHDLANFTAMLLSGVVGSLVAGPLGNAMKLAVRRVRISDRDPR